MYANPPLPSEKLALPVGASAGAGVAEPGGALGAGVAFEPLPGAPVGAGLGVGVAAGAVPVPNGGAADDPPLQPETSTVSTRTTSRFTRCKYPLRRPRERPG